MSQDSSIKKHNSLERGVLKCFERLFPADALAKYDESAQSYLLAMISNMASIAFQAYKSPKDYCHEQLGIIEKTRDGTTVNHLNKDYLNKSIEGVLKINLQSAQHVKDSDVGFQGKSDPYVVFTSGISMVHSEVIDNATNPVWNSTHYLLLRKNSTVLNESEKLVIDLFDYDTGRESGILSSLVRMFNIDDLIGNAELDLISLKKQGVQNHEVQLTPKKRLFCRPTVLNFTTQYLTLDDYCEETGRAKDCYWLDKRVVEDVKEDWKTLSRETTVGHAPMTPICFFESDSSGTEAWLHIHDTTKTLVLAFRGTEVGELADILADADVRSDEVDDLGKDIWTIKPNEYLNEKGVTVHRGFLNAYRAVRETIIETMHTISCWEDDWVFLVTGHSLGGALAVLAAYELTNRRRSNGHGPKVGMLSVGAPKLASRKFAANYNETVIASFRVVNKSDMVHTIPYPYIHVDEEVVVHPSGEIDYDTQNLQSGLCSKKLRELKIDDNEVVLPPESDKPLTTFRDALTAKYHLQTYYFELVSSAVRKFMDNALGGRGKK
eukprot:g2722.t1